MDIKYIRETYPEAIIMDGFDDAIVGIDTDGRVVYDYDKMTEVLINRDGMEYEEASEYIDYNCIRALPYYGEMRPIIMYSE